VLGPIEGILSIGFDSSNQESSINFNSSHRPTISEMAHGLKSFCRVWPIKVIDKHTISDFIYNVVSSVECFINKMIFSSIFSDFSRCTPTGKKECFAFNITSFRSVPDVNIVSSSNCVFNWSIKDHDCNIGGVWATLTREIPTVVDSEF